MTAPKKQEHIAGTVPIIAINLIGSDCQTLYIASKVQTSIVTALLESPSIADPYC